MFWNMLGQDWLYKTTLKLNDTTRLYWLNNARVEIDITLKQKLDKLYASSKSINELGNEIITYRYADSTKKDIKLSELQYFSDLTNGITNWYDSPSRLDALYKVISNSDASLNAKNINLRFSGKFMVAGKQNPDDQYEMPLSKTEKKTIEDSALRDKPVEAIKSMIDIKRYVEDMRKLELDPAFEYDYFLIGSMYNIPKEILGIYLKDSNSLNESSKEKAIGRHVGYSLQPKADDLANGLETFFGYDKESKDITITFDHLPFMQALEADRAETNERNAKSLSNLLKAGVTRESAAKLLKMDVEFKPEKDEEPIGEDDTAA